MNERIAMKMVAMIVGCACFVVGIKTKRERLSLVLITLGFLGFGATILC